MNRKLALRSIFFTITMPGIGVVCIPYLILVLSGPITIQEFFPFLMLAILLFLFSIYVLLHCIWSFAKHGKGTLAPVDPPRTLVVQGIYRFTRNPMYLAVVGALLSEAAIFNSYAVLVYAALGFILFHLFVIYYEEPRLLEQFGAEYEEYRKSVPRWGIRLRPKKKGDILRAREGRP